MRQFSCAIAVAIAVVGGILASGQARAIDVAPFVKRGAFEDIKISPTGEYYAASVPLGNTTALVILARSDRKVTGTISLGKNAHVSDFWWVNDRQVLFSDNRRFGALDMPQPAGNLYVTSVEGRADILVGQHVDVQGLGSKIRGKKTEAVAAFLVDDLPGDDRAVLISVAPFNNDPYTRLERLDLSTGRRTPVGRAPVRRATFMTDNAGVVRAAHGAGTDNVSKLYLRGGESTQWQLINDESVSRRIEWPLGFSEDNATVYLQAEQAAGPDVIVALDVLSGERRTVLSDDIAEPEATIYRPYTKTPVGARFMAGVPRTMFIDAESPQARHYRSLEAAFPGQSVFITSTTRDGRYTLVQTSSDRNPGDFFLYDTVDKKAEHVISRREWLDPEHMAGMRPIALKARDGLDLHGYLTVPREADGAQLPLVVMPHGGPYGIYDRWAFNDDTQLLAAAGYGVLQVNYRGSGNYGRSFEAAGARQWGGTMQDDLTDATRWAIEEGIADASRICIYGGSYGAYAALMGVSKEPALYRCAVGYVGVYDLPIMHTTGDIQRRGSGETYLREWIGEREAIAAVSPARDAKRIRVPVLLAAGGEDERAPIEHSRRMEQALRAAGVPVETLYYPTEGHGFYQDAHRTEFYETLLSFLARNIGGQAPEGR